ncbi:MAG: hypothetical protein MJA83_00460 [Gammaproteobacteria bacterium]|nr:hypothetical protein [Gammaproteobacteria bacterium]
MSEVPEPARAILYQYGIDWEKWLLIEDKTLRAIRKDAKGYKDALESLTEAQDELNKRVNELNLVREDHYKLQKVSYEKSVQIYKLENPLWYQHPAFWGVVGFAGGSALTIMALALGGVL